MDKETVINYIEKGLETELLDKLDSYTVSDLDKRFWNLVGILVVLQERAKIDWYQPNQALVKLMVNALPELFKNDGEQLSTLFDALEKNAVAPYIHLSYLCRQFIIGIGDKEDKIMSIGLKSYEYKVLIEKLWTLNLSLLKQSIADPESTHNDITIIFYNNLDHLEEHRRTIIRENALEEYRKYISAKPYPYLENYIRPYWTGTTVDSVDHYFHVPEPFHVQIFTDKLPWVNFIDFAKEGDVVAAELIDDLLVFQEVYNNKPLDSEDRTVILYSDEMSNLRYGTPKNMIRLQSTRHKAVRKECLPPNYRLA